MSTSNLFFLLVLFIPLLGNTQDDISLEGLKIVIDSGSSYLENIEAKNTLIVHNSTGKTVSLKIGNSSAATIPEGQHTYVLIKNKEIGNIVAMEGTNTVFRLGGNAKLRGTNIHADGNKINYQSTSGPLVPEEECYLLPDYLFSRNRMPSSRSSSDPAYNIIYNCQTGVFSHFIDGKLTALQNFRPKIDAEIRFSSIDCQPYTDSLIVNFTSIQRNLEDKEKFGESFTSQQSATTNDSSDDDDDKEEAVGQANLSLKEQIGCFAQEMQRYYEFQLNNSSFSLDTLRQHIPIIQRSVRQYFSIEDASLTKLKKELEQKIDKEFNDAKENLDVKATLESGLSYYQKILRYNTHNLVYTYQAKEDLTSLTLNHYRHEQRLVNTVDPLLYFNKGGFKIDFSTGLVLHNLSDHIFTTVSQEVYDTSMVSTNPLETQIDTTTKARIIRENGLSYNWGLTVLAHFYSRLMLCGSKRFNASFTVGLLVNNENSQLNIKPLAGLSLLLGSEQRLAISGGIIIGTVDRLSQSQRAGDDGTLLDVMPGTTPDIKITPVVETGCFIGLTYNFGGT